ncbi:MAG TPA: ferredoxin [Solirubrobacteraceae bacterium]|nr:ferredoxin [Solirubrobacteraceae bacterium]
MVDRRRCQGNAQCAVIAPRVFATDEGGYAVVLNRGSVPDGEEEAATAAQGACPEQAIVILGAESQADPDHSSR